MRVAFLCATRRGHRCLQTLTELTPKGSLYVFSFREKPWEPPFLDDIRTLTLSAGGEFFESTHVGEARFRSFWESTPIDLLLAINWRYMVPRSVYLRPRAGAFVFHDSLLPEYRGFAPTVWAMINGEKQTGVTLFEMSEEMDTGDIVDQKGVPIGPDSTIAEVMERVTLASIELLESNFDRLVNGSASRVPQDHSHATFTCKRLPSDNEINWGWPTDKLYNFIRACGAPYPGAFTYVGGKKVIIWAAKRLPEAGRYVGSIPGRVVQMRPGEGVVVLTGDGTLLLKQIQIEGSEAACAADIFKSVSETLGHK